MANVLHDSPLEFMQEAANSDECVAQSVIPNGDGTYTVACSCERWETQAPGRTEGLNAARRHTGHFQ
ncbi:hypothetical protein [Mycobacterium sp. MUNTM1]